MKILLVVSDLMLESLGIMYLSSGLKKAGHEVRLAAIREDDVMSIAATFQPQVVGYGLHSGLQHQVLSTNSRLKERFDFFAAFGGPHPTFFPEMIEQDGVDGLCIGEGDAAFVDLVARLETGQSIDDTPNWWIKQDGHIYRNPVAPLIQDLDSLPFPDHDLMKGRDHFLKHRRMRTILTGRGCPYDCSYCFNHAYMEIYGQTWAKVRRRSVDNVIEEAQWLKVEHGAEFFYFADDTFIIHPAWIEEFSTRYRKRVGVPFVCNVRANLVTDDLIRLLREAGCHSACMGVETADDEIRNLLFKRRMSKEQMIEAAGVLHRYGIKLYTANILGVPNGSLDIDLATLALNIAMKPAAVHVGLLQPFPGTEIRRYVEEHGLLDTDQEALPSSLYTGSVIKMPPGEKRKIQNLGHLFPLIVEMPFLAPMARRLASLPLDPIYLLLRMLITEATISRRIFQPPPSIGFYARRIKARMGRSFT
ncbi:MAG: radical SAM protein [Anaerolineae bacterium]|nr:radical SAM protein [Anaerolineae bacterium]